MVVRAMMWRRDEWARYAGVTAAVGMPGGGKSYLLAEMASRAMAKGVRVWSNAGFDVAGTNTIESFEEFASLRGPGLVVWDELPLYFSSRRWAEFPDGMLYKFTQIRKDGLRLAYSTIHEGMVDVSIRRVTFWYWHCRTVLTRKTMVRTLWPPSEFRKASAKPLRRQIRRLDMRVASLYDTMGKVAVTADVGERVSSVSNERFSMPDAAGVLRSGSGRVVREARPMVDGDPWGAAPVGNDAGLFGDDAARLGWDRSAWPRP